MSNEDITVLVIFAMVLATIFLARFLLRLRKKQREAAAQVVVVEPLSESDERLDYGAGFFPENEWRGFATPEEIVENEASRVLWSVPREQFVLRPEHWGLGVSVPFALWHEAQWDVLPGDPHPNATGIALVEGWNVHSRYDLLEMLFWLYTEGHRMRYNEQRRYFDELDDASFAQAQQTLQTRAAHQKASAEELWRLQRVRNNDRHIQQVDFTAWDLVRFAMLVRLGVAKEYITVDEGHDFLAVISPEVQACYGSWPEMGESFRIARWYWNAVSGEAERAADVGDLHRQELLVAPDSPWAYIPWDMTLPTDHGLFATALEEEDIIEDRSALILHPETYWGRRYDELVGD